MKIGDKVKVVAPKKGYETFHGCIGYITEEHMEYCGHGHVFVIEFECSYNLWWVNDFEWFDSWFFEPECLEVV